jgi:hypothetical protein
VQGQGGGVSHGMQWMDAEALTQRA